MDRLELEKRMRKALGTYTNSLVLKMASNVADVAEEYAQSKAENLPVSDFRISSKAETIRVLRNRAEYFENIGGHKYPEIECRCAIDIIERLVPPDNFQQP